MQRAEIIDSIRASLLEYEQTGHLWVLVRIAIDYDLRRIRTNKKLAERLRAILREQEEDMTRYILNSAVITSPGSYIYSLIPVELARAWLRRGPFESTVGYPETAAALERLTAQPCGVCLHSSGELDRLPCPDCGGTGETVIRIPVNRRAITMLVGDEALVFRLVLPPGTPRIDPADKGKLTPEFVAANCEIGLLRKTA